MERMTKFRVGVFLVLVAAMVFFFGLRAYNVQVVNATVSDNSISTDTYTTAVSAARGQILDRNGNILVSNRASYNLIINGYVLYNSDNPNESLRQLTRLCKSLGLNYAEHLPVSLKKPYEYTLDGYPEAWQSYFHQYLSARSWDSDISAQQLVKLMKNSYHIPNDWEEEDCRRVIGLRYELELDRGVFRQPRQAHGAERTGHDRGDHHRPVVQHPVRRPHPRPHRSHLR